MQKIKFLIGLFSVFFLSGNLFSLSAARRNASPVDLSSGSGRFVFKNLMPDFWQFWKQAEKLDLESRTRLFRQLVIAPNQKLFDQTVGQIDEARLKNYLSVLPGKIPQMRAISFQIEYKTNNYWRAFSKKFPHASPPDAVYIMPSLGNFDGQARPFDNKLVLLLGVDALVETLGGINNRAFFHHEFFHIYHLQQNAKLRRGAEEFFLQGKPPALYNLLWIEGLAVYASRILNPSATDRQIFLSDNLVENSSLVLPDLVLDLNSKLDSHAFPDIAQFFFKSGSANQNFPPRSGYYLGFLIARKLARKYSMEKLLNFSGEELKANISEILAENLRI